MVFGHHDIAVDREQIAADAHLTADGTDAAGLVDAARHAGLGAFGRMVHDVWDNSLRLPTILHLRNNHFVVLEALPAQDLALVIDPALGKRIVFTRAELRVVMSGLVLEFERTRIKPL
jgi:ABC-type bacteriocin/lantibiotic exporter with double-glycine peptidase domain